MCSCYVTLIVVIVRDLRLYDQRSYLSAKLVLYLHIHEIGLPYSSKDNFHLPATMDRLLCVLLLLTAYFAYYFRKNTIAACVSISKRV